MHRKHPGKGPLGLKFVMLENLKLNLLNFHFLRSCSQNWSNQANICAQIHDTQHDRRLGL